MMKIMVTGYPSLENAVKSLNIGADAYVMKPVDPENLQKVVEEKLKEQEEAERMTEEKMAEWIQTRIRKLDQGLVETLESKEDKISRIANSVKRKKSW